MTPTKDLRTGNSRSRGRRTQRWCRRLILEQLENRVVLSYGLDASGNLTLISGDINPDTNSTTTIDTDDRGGVSLIWKGSPLSFPAGVVSKIVFFPDSGHNKIFVRNTNVQVQVIVDPGHLNFGPSSNDLFVGNEITGVQGIHAFVALNNSRGGGEGSVKIDDQSGTVGRTFDIHSTGALELVQWENATVIFGYNDKFDLLGGSGGNIFHVIGTSSQKTHINTSSQKNLHNNVVNVLGNSGPLEIGGAGNATVNIGSRAPSLGGTLAAIGLVTVFTGVGDTILVVDDSGNRNASTHFLGTRGSNSEWGYISGMGDAEIKYSKNLDRLTLHTGLASGNVANVWESNVETYVVGHADATVNIGDGNAQGILGSLYIQNSGHHTAINVDDTANNTARAMIVGEFSSDGLVPFLLGQELGVFRGTDPGTDWSYVAGLSPYPINYRHDETSSLTIHTSPVEGNAIKVWESAVPTNLIGLAATTVIIGNAGNIQGLQSLVAISNPPDYTRVLIDDSRGPTARNFILGTNPDGIFGHIVDTTQPNFNVVYKYADTSGLAIHTGVVKGNFVNVYETRVVTNLVGNADTTVRIANNHGVQDILGAINISNRQARTAILIDDRGDNQARNFSIGTIPNDPARGYILGLAPVQIGYEYADTSSLTIDTSAVFNNIINVLQTGVTTNLIGHNEATVRIADNFGVQNIKGMLNISSPSGFTGPNSLPSAAMTILVDDLGDNRARNTSLGTKADDSNWGYIAGLTPAQAPINYKYADTSSLTIITSAVDSNFTNVYQTGVSTKLIGHAAATVRIGDITGLQNIFGAIDIFNPPKFTGPNSMPSPGTAIQIDDRGDSVARNFLMGTIFNPSGPRGYISYLSPAPITYKYSGTSSLTIDTSDIDGNVANVRATGVPTDLWNHANATVRIGDEFNGVQRIVADLNIQNPPARTEIFVDDSANVNSRSAILGSFMLAVSPFESPWGYISGLAPANINYKVYDTSHLTISGGSGGNFFDVFDSPNVILPGGVDTTLNTGSHTDIVNIRETTGALTVNTQGGSNLINVGSLTSTLDQIRSPLTINGAGGVLNTLNIHDQGTTAAHTFSLTATALTRAGGPAINFDSQLSVNFYGGSGGNIINVTAASAIVNAGMGNDTINVGTSSGTLTGLGTTRVQGQGGIDSLLLNGAGETVGQTSTFSKLLLQYFETAGTRVVYSTDMENIAFTGGSGNDTVNIENTAASTSTMINTGGGNDTFVMRNLSATLGRLTFNGGSGVNTLDYSAVTTRVIVNLLTGTATNLLGGISNIANVFGGAGDDELIGNAAANTLRGNGGRDSLFGGDGIDSLYGGEGDDYLDGGKNIDFLFGGLGVDTFKLDSDVRMQALEAALWDFLLIEDKKIR